MRISTLATAAVTAGAVSLVGAPSASADDSAVTVTAIGGQARLVDGDVVQGWTIYDLSPSTDVIPYPVQGALWESTAADEAIRGVAIPIVSNLNARAQTGETYRALFGVATPQGVNPAPLAPGQLTQGKVYFDVTGPVPNSVVYNAAGEDRIIWMQSAPEVIIDDLEVIITPDEVIVDDFEATITPDEVAIEETEVVIVAPEVGEGTPVGE